jgi:hypothetical protein
LSTPRVIGGDSGFVTFLKAVRFVLRLKFFFRPRKRRWNNEEEQEPCVADDCFISLFYEYATQMFAQDTVQELRQEVDILKERVKTLEQLSGAVRARSVQTAAKPKPAAPNITARPAFRP